MADRYWVGGSATWDGTAGTKWATSSGGAGGASVPTSSDNVFINASSGAVTVTLSTGNTGCLNLNFTGFTGTWAGSGAISITGNMTLATGMTRTYTGAITFIATSGTNDITLSGKTMANSFTFNGIGGGWRLVGTFNNGTSNITLTNGTLDTNGVTVTAGQLLSNNTNTRTLTLGASTINLSTSTTINSSGLAFNADTSTINFGTSSSGLNTSGLTFNNVVITSNNSGFILGNGVNTYNNLTIQLNSYAAVRNVVMILTDTQTVSSVFTVTGGAIGRILIKSNTAGTQRTISAPTTTISYVDFQDIIVTGGGSWSGTSIGDADNNTGITFATPVTRYWIGGTGNWSDTAEWSATSGGSGGATMPIVHDTVIFNNNSFSGSGQTVTVNLVARCGSINFTGVNQTVSLVTTFPLCFYNDFTLDSDVSITGGSGLIYEGMRNSTFARNSATISSLLEIKTSGSNTLSFGDGYTSSAALTLTSGSLDLNNVNTSILNFVSTGSITRTLTMGSGTVSLTGTGTVWSVASTDMTLNRNTSTIKITNTTSTARTFAGGGLTYYNFWSDTGTSTASLTISGSNTFNQFKDTGTIAHSILFTTGTTQTIDDWQVSGNAGQLITINSTTTGTHTLTKASGTVTADYLNIQHSIATGGATWNAGANSVNNQSVSTAGSGWIFGIAPNGNMFLMF